MSRRAILAFSISGCAGHDDPVSAAPVQESLALESEPGPEPEPAPDPLQCLPDGFSPELPDLPSTRAPTGRCHRFGVSEKRELETQAREQWYLEHEHATLDVDFGCDRLVGPIRELTLEYGAGHGFTLDLARWRLEPSSGDYDLMLIRYGTGYGEPDGPGAGVSVGRVDEDDVARVLETVRPAMALRLREHFVADEDGIGGFAMSSADAHVLVRLTDARGKSREIQFAGYLGSERQDVWIPATLAADSLWQTIEQTKLQGVASSDLSRELFTERYLSAREHGWYAWWVAERYVQMVGSQGTLDLVPSLVEHLQATGDDALVVRTRSYALDSIATLTGATVVGPKDENGEYSPVLLDAWTQACSTHP